MNVDVDILHVKINFYWGLFFIRDIDFFSLYSNVLSRFFLCEKNCERTIDVASPIMESELSRVVLKSKEDRD